jgi:predicted amidohydrolase
MARYVTVCSVSHRPEAPYTDVDARLQQARTFAVRAARMGAQIVSFPEVYPHLGVPIEQWPQVAEEAGGRTTDFMAELARELGIHVIWPLIERRDGLLRNSALLIDRRGDVAGVYHKMFPTIGEIDAGVVPGTEAPVFDTELGRIGIAICFDLNFRPLMQGLAENGAEVVFFCSMYRGGLQLRMWAHEFAYYLVSAIGTELGQVVDMSGEVLCEATYEALALTRINLDRRLLHMDFNWEKMDAMLAKYGTGVSFRHFTREAKYTVASEMEGITVDDLIAEFALEPMPDYFARAIRRRDQALGKI